MSPTAPSILNQKYMNLKQFNAQIKNNSALRKGIALPEYLLNEKIERAIKANSNIADLFLVIPVSQEHGEGDTELETKYGKLRVFFCKQLYEFQKYGKATFQALLLNKKKFNYPQVSKVSGRPFRDITSGGIDVTKSHLEN